MSARYVMAGYWAGIVAIIAAVLALPAVDLLAGSLTWTLLTLVAAAAIAVAVRWHRPRDAWPWGLLAVAILISAGGDAIYATVQAGAPRGLLAVANVLYLLMFVTAATALLRFTRSGTGIPEQAGLIDAVTVTLVLVLLVYLTMVSPVLPDLSELSDPAILAYVIGDGLLLATVIRLLTTRRRTPAVLYLVGGALVALLADVGYGLQDSGRSWHQGAVTDIGWLLLYACWGAAALHPSMTRLTEPDVMPARDITARSGSILVLTALTAPAALLVEAVAGRVRDGVVLAVASTVLFVLSLSRIASAANTHRRSLLYRDHHDTLTGLANRAYFTERVRLAQHRSAAAAVLLIDLDDFKVVNEGMGHSVGDEVLTTVGHRLTGLLGRDDLAARIGGDEFGVLVVSGATPASVAALGQDVCAALAEPISLHGQEIRITGCVGIALSPPHAAGVAGGGPAAGTAQDQDLGPGTGIAPGAATGAGPGVPDPAVATLALAQARPAVPRQRSGEDPAPSSPDPVEDDLLRQAGLALQAARADGMGRWCVYRSDVHGALVERMRLRAALDLALADGAFELYFQPIVALATQRPDEARSTAESAYEPDEARSTAESAYHPDEARSTAESAYEPDEARSTAESAYEPDEALSTAESAYEPDETLSTAESAYETVGFEALIRWDHPTLGLVQPSEFIDLAEETGQIEAIGAWVMRGAIGAAAEWYRTQPSSPYISVNVSARQFRTPGLAQRIDRELEAAGLPASHLMVELTESVLLRDSDQVWAELATLRDTGVQLALDDFGTGFSSLSYLVQTPIDVIKIDKTFVRTLATSPRHYAIIDGIVRLARQLGLQVVAEGIENATDRDVLVRMGCRYGQGYLFAEPMPRAAADAWLAAGSGRPS